MLFTKKKKSPALCFFAIVLLLAFSGCSDGGGGSGPGSNPKVTITITEVPTVTPAYKYYSLTLYEESSPNFGIDDPPPSMSTGLKGYKTQSLSIGGTAFTFDEFPAGNYVLILGCSSDMKAGDMYITGTSANPATKQTVAVNFKDSISFSENFLSTPLELTDIPPFFAAE